MMMSPFVQSRHGLKRSMSSPALTVAAAAATSVTTNSAMAVTPKATISTTTAAGGSGSVVLTSSSSTPSSNATRLVQNVQPHNQQQHIHRRHQFQKNVFFHSASSSSSSLTITTFINHESMKTISTAATTSANFSSTASESSSDEMKDEYGEMTADGETFKVDDFVLENGEVLPSAQLRYQTYGELNDAKDNVIVVCHALTGNASLHSWWGDLLGDGLAFDTSKYFIVCCNILGSCYGSTNPQSFKADGKTEYGLDFPDISVQDTVRLQLRLLKDEIGAASIHSVIGGSFGGMQAMEFAVQGGRTGGDFVQDDGSPYVRSVVPIACGAAHTAWQIAISEVQRQAIYADPNWTNGNPFKATKGLEVARQMGMISYRTPQGYRGKFGREIQESKDASSTSPVYGSDANWQVKSYLEYQGIKFIDRFDPVTYVKMTEQMDSHDISRNRGGSVSDVLKQIEIPACVMGIDSDILYPLSEQEELAKYMPKAQLKIIHSDDGHDGFLLEQDQVGQHIVDFLKTVST